MQGLQKIGVWEYARHFKNRFTWLNTHEELSVEETDKMPLWNRTLTVVTILVRKLYFSKGFQSLIIECKY